MHFHRWSLRQSNQGRKNWLQLFQSGVRSPANIWLPPCSCSRRFGFGLPRQHNGCQCEVRGGKVHSPCQQHRRYHWWLFPSCARAFYFQLLGQCIPSHFSGSILSITISSPLLWVRMLCPWINRNILDSSWDCQLYHPIFIPIELQDHRAGTVWPPSAFVHRLIHAKFPYIVLLSSG